MTTDKTDDGIESLNIRWCQRGNHYFNTPFTRPISCPKHYIQNKKEKKFNGIFSILKKIHQKQDVVLNRYITKRSESLFLVNTAKNKKKFFIDLKKLSLDEKPCNCPSSIMKCRHFNILKRYIKRKKIRNIYILKHLSKQPRGKTK